ncbi:MAG: YceI family protein [Verrucomicrobiota bacterium]
MITSCVAAAALLLAASTEAQTVKYNAKPGGGRMQIDGTSTVHDWTVEGKLIAGSMELDGSFPADNSAAAAPAFKTAPKVQVTIPVRSLKSGKTAMDSVMHEAMKQEKHPTITYTVTEMTPSKDARQAGKPYKYNAKGDLTVSGVKKTISMPVEMDRVDANSIKVTGSVAVKMTDFGIQPPAPKIALGLISTGDEVKLKFEWLTVKAP